jgi:hypothetical protein
MVLLLTIKDMEEEAALELLKDVMVLLLLTIKDVEEEVDPHATTTSDERWNRRNVYQQLHKYLVCEQLRIHG